MVGIRHECRCRTLRKIIVDHKYRQRTFRRIREGMNADTRKSQDNNRA
jgi:hypothetical protein